MNTEKKNWRANYWSPLSDWAERKKTLVPLGTTTLQNPRVPRGFYGRTAGQFRSPSFRPFPFLCPRFPRPTRTHSRTAASRPPRWVSAVPACDNSPGSFPLCVSSDLCGVPLRAPTVGAFPENTAEIGRNAEGERADVSNAKSLQRWSAFRIHPCRLARAALLVALPPCVHHVSGVISAVPIP